jgi:ketosteroid isomerase-like protein
MVADGDGAPVQRDDETQIRALVTRYFMALDRRDHASLEECFAADATAWYDREYGPGRESIVAYLRGAMSRWNATTHLGSNVEVVMVGAIAHTQVDAVAYLVSAADTNATSRIRVRGLRYSDTCILAAGRWVFSRRERTASWSFDVDGQDFSEANLALPSRRPHT